MAPLLIALGGALGTLLRYAANVACAAAFGPGLPYATFAVNVTGSFALALMVQALTGRTWLGVPLLSVVGTGVLGGFTTYSSFNLELLRMFQEHQAGRALAYIVATISICLGAAAWGWHLGTRLVR